MNLVTITLKPYHEKFLRYQFATPKGNIKVTRNHEIGRYICAMVEFAKKPVKHDPPFVNLEIPSTEGIPENGFACISKASAIKITDYTEAYFMLYFRQFIFTCRNFNIQYKDAINMFIEMHDIGHDLINYDRLKKNDYRFRLKVKDFIREGIKSFYNQNVKQFSYNLSHSQDTD
jgi:hypothetical protein